MKKIIIPLLGLFLIGCATPVKFDTLSGKPEVTIQGKVADQVGAKLADRMINNGYSISSSSKYLMVFEKPFESMGAALLFGSQYDTNPVARITYTIIEAETTTRVVTSLIAVTNAGSAFERTTIMNHSQDSLKYQDMLIEIAEELGTTFVPGEVPQRGSSTTAVEIEKGSTFAETVEMERARIQGESID